MKLPSQAQMEAFRQEQQEAFKDLADECEKCETIYVEQDFGNPKGCPKCNPMM